MKGNVSPEDLMAVMQAHLGGIMDALGPLAEGGELTADDLIEFFSIAIAAVLDNDAHIRTPRDFRLAGEAVGKVVAQRAQELREFSDQAGIKALDAIRSGVPMYAGTEPYGN